MTVKPDLYFGASDRQMESFVDLAAFREALVYGILFQGNLVIPDIFQFISGHMAELLLTDPLARNFITYGFRHGAIIPAFRTDNGGSFRASLKEIKASRIQGLHPQAEQMASILDDGVGDQHLYYRLWPKEALSVGYRKTLERCLLAPDIAAKFPDLGPLWKESADMREAMIQGTFADELGGFRRGDLYNALNCFLNKDPVPVHDIRSIWTKLSDQQSVSIAQRMLKWLNYCYSYNQGRMFDLKPELSALDNTDIQFVRHLAALNDTDGSAPIFSEEFRIPSAAAMLTIDPAQIYEVRNSELGTNYFTALNTWRLAPSDNTSDALLERLRAYTAAIHTAYLACGKSIFNWQWHLKVHVPCGKTRWGRVGRNAFGAMASEAIGSLIPHIGLASIVGQFAAATYETLPANVRDKIGPPMGIDTRTRIEISEHLTQLYSGDKASGEASIQ
jgi:hypothetical protein